MDATQRLGIPLIHSGQAQKEILHNEALQLLDTLVGAAVEEPPRTSPPAAPAVGSCYIVGPGATGEWASRDSQIAAYTQAGWRYASPAEGTSAYVRSSGQTAVYREGGWETGLVRGAAIVIAGDQVVGARAGAIADPAGGAQVDTEARAAISAILLAMRSHGLIGW